MCSGSMTSPAVISTRTLPQSPAVASASFAASPRMSVGDAPRWVTRCASAMRDKRDQSGMSGAPS